MLRSPLAVLLGDETGILTGSEGVPHVTVMDGASTENVRLRIQVIQDLAEEQLIFSLLDMKENGAAGAEVIVTQNGDYTLPGFAGSALSSLDISVSSYAALWEMVRNNYGGRLVDVLDVQTA